jgi:hypothetical protein
MEVRLLPIRADKFKSLPKAAQELLVENGAVPINEVFWNFWAERAKINLLYGGYGSGKSVFIADLYINLALNTTYFKGLFGRKVAEDVRDSVFATICDRIEYFGLEDHFIYSRASNSKMRIRVWKTGNIMIPFGADRIDKLKSVKDVTHIFCEEFDQFEVHDYRLLISRLRVEDIETQFFAAFNTDKVTKEHWLYKEFFNDDMPFQEGRLLKIFCNYTDNVFINQAEYEQTLWESAGFEEKRFREIAGGEWGTADTTNKYSWAFERPKHVLSKDKQPYDIILSRPIYLSFDFNVDPITCTVSQHDGLKWSRTFKEYRLRNSDIYQLCERIKTDFPGCYLVATGDASGRNRNASNKGGMSFIMIIKQELELSEKQIQFPTSNPGVKDRRMLWNAILRKHPDFKIYDDCLFLIDDLETLPVDEQGLVPKAKAEAKKKSHLTDSIT